MSRRRTGSSLRKKLSSALAFCSNAAILATGVVPNMKDTTILDNKTKDQSSTAQKHSPRTVMDKETQSNFEDVHRHTPRYLFRLWSDGEGGTNPSGGRKDLNTTSAVTPLAFANGGGHASAYDMTKDEFTTMADRHLRTDPCIVTEFSSWSASLAFILNKCSGLGPDGMLYERMSEDHLFVAILDVEMLHSTNQAFYVPLLSCLSPNINWNLPHEYLIHGVIQGPWYKAIPLSALRSAAYHLETLVGSSWDLAGDLSIHQLTEQQVKMARTVGELYGERFAFAMTTMLLCCQKRERELWYDQVDSQTLETVSKGIKGLKPPEGWRTANRYLTLGIDPRNFGDTVQRERLVLALYQRFGAYKLALMYRPTNEQSGAGQSHTESSTEEKEISQSRPDLTDLTVSKSSERATSGEKRPSRKLAVWRSAACDHAPKKSRRTEAWSKSEDW